MNNADIRILIAEDSAIQAEKLRRVLAAEGYSVVVAKDGVEGLLKAKELKPELVISDIMMPGMNGFELCKHIKSDEDISSTPVILLTSLSDPTDVISGLECGADNFIVKPYDEPHLLSRIKHIFLNRELQENSRTQMGVEIHFSGKKYFISSEKKQILDLLISTYENAVLRNTELIKVQEKLEDLNKELEQKMQEAEKAKKEAEAATQAKSSFLANMNHELRTPLNSINGFSEVLADETFGPLNEKQKKYVNNVLTSGKHLLLLINQILDMAKVESGKMKLDLSSLSMKSLLNEISTLVADMVSKKKIQMSLDIAEDLPNIEADELKVKQILYNLLSNAVKFTPEGGQIGMRAKKAGSEIEIVVWDTGVGIAPENMEKIFEGFFRVDTPYSRVTEGTGLGLPLSKKLVELHGGKLSVESEGLNKGTSVRFILPVVSREVV
ncbi:MAG: hybrid sensor histidine kinase/response regulator [Deltaproteobacteria bacterium]|nr:hybrid sensor histidine kinase/response regulator [Deltaproteobacteria bacterium]